MRAVSFAGLPFVYAFVHQHQRTTMDIPTYLVTPAASQESAKAVTANQDDGLKSVDTGLGEDSSKQIGPQDKQYDTPP